MGADKPQVHRFIGFNIKGFINPTDTNHQLSYLLLRCLSKVTRFDAFSEKVNKAIN